MAPLRLGTSYWLDRPGRRRAALRPSLHGVVDCDIAIVGAGVTGCAAAYFFARAGARVVVIEQNHVGRGSTAASTALLMQEPDADFADLDRRYGFATARRRWMYSRTAVHRMRALLHTIGAPAVHRLSSLYCAHNGRVVGRLRRELALRHRAGIAPAWLSEEEATRLAGFGTPAAILTRGNAQVDPYGAALALARVARAHGARMFERSAARRIRASGSSVAIDLSNGEVRASWVVIATGYATPEFKPLAGRFRLKNTYVVATPRLTRQERRAVGMRDVMLWDTARPYHYARWTPDGRLLFGGDDHPQTSRRTRRALLRMRTGQLWRELIDRYPALENRRPEYAWEGLFAATPDGLPFVGRHRRYPRHLFALGYGGNGMTFGFLAARALVQIARGREDEAERLFGFDRFSR
jgi:glycine/D-amino acid oxidase-like deaminating enzyme